MFDDSGKNWDSPTKIIKEETDEENGLYTPDQKDILKSYFTNPVSEHNRNKTNLKISKIKLKMLSKDRTKESKSSNFKKLKFKMDPHSQMKCTNSILAKIKNFEKIGISPGNSGKNSQEYSDKYIKRSSSFLKCKKSKDHNLKDNSVISNKNKTVDSFFSVN